MLPLGAQEILREILSARSPGKGPTDGVALDETWFVSRVEVKGHAGIGESPVRLDFPPAPGLTIVTAPNGTGKTSVVHALQVGLGGSSSDGGVLGRNLHYDRRHILVSLESDARQVTVSHVGEGPTRWSEDGAEDSVPGAWQEAFHRYQPVLLYPEVAKVIDQPDSLHELLASALDLHVLEELQRDVDTVRKASRDAKKRVEGERQRVDQLFVEERYAELKEQVATLGPCPDASVRASIRDRVGTLSSRKALSLPMLPAIAEPTIDVDELARHIAAYTQARTQVVDGSARLRDALDRLVDPANQALAQHRKKDMCPVCGAEGRGWFSVAGEEAARLRGLLSSHDAAKRQVVDALDGFVARVPQVPETELASLRERPGFDDDAAALRGEWDSVRKVLAALPSDQITEERARNVGDRVDALRQQRDALSERIEQTRAASHDEHAELKSAVEGWLVQAEVHEKQVAREGSADQLNKWVGERIKETRSALFEPIAEHAKQVWSRLNPDGGLDVTDLTLGGGTKQAKKVKVRLRLGDTAVPEGGDSIRVLSTGQRNALSLATYLPRAAQQSSPFGFMVLDDPVQAFDDWRVRYLAQQLTELAESTQIVVFTHDDRLWREVVAHGARPRRIQLDRPAEERSLVRVADATSPGQLLLRELRDALCQYDGKSASINVTEEAITAFTLAVCRQALDAETCEQIEVLGRRSGKDAEAIQADLNAAQDTKRMLGLLDRYCGDAGVCTVDRTPHGEAIDALNQGSHGQAPDEVTWERRWEWLDATVELVARVACASTEGSP
jgi:ABC-type transport system involved in cytochrome c biogenesis ATPase subunit/predicted  nucleic acid-binding Zn-ribbon protein